MGKRKAHLLYAIESISELIGEVILISNIYETEAWGNTQQQDFLNQVINVHTYLSAIECLDIIQIIEKNRNRTRGIHWGPRTLDIDILFFNHEIINTHRLVIPHKFIAKRLFVLLPLSEILSELIHPVSCKSIKQLLTECTDKSAIAKFKNGL